MNLVEKDEESDSGKTISDSERVESSFVDIALRCEFVKYAKADWHTTLRDRKCPTAWGIANDWDHPASPLSDEGQDGAETEEKEEYEEESENEQQGDDKMGDPMPAQIPPSTRVFHPEPAPTGQAAEEADGDLEGGSIVMNGDQHEDEDGHPLFIDPMFIR